MTNQEELDNFTITRMIGPDWKPGVPTVWKLNAQEKSAINSLTLKQVLELIGGMETAHLIQPIMPFQTEQMELEQWKRAQIRDGLRAELRQSAERIWKI